MKIHNESTSNESKVPAQITSPLWSEAKETNCLEEGVVNVLKFRYRNKSQARTVPSRDALNRQLLLDIKCNAVTAFVCSENVTKQKPEETVHTWRKASMQLQKTIFEGILIWDFLSVINNYPFGYGENVEKIKEINFLERGTQKTKGPTQSISILLYAKLITFAFFKSNQHRD